MMNYIKHFNHWLELVAVDDRLSSSHISVYVALFQLWNKNRFPKKISVFRNEVMMVSKIGSTKTYYKCLHALHQFGYINYRPSYNPLKGSVIVMEDLSAMTVEDDFFENSGNAEGIASKKILNRHDTTQVQPGQKTPGSYSKSAIGPTQLVTPLYTNNINRLNSKQRERRTHAQKGLEENFYEQKSKTSSKKTLTENSKTTSAFPTGTRSESDKQIPDGFSKPSLNEVEDFFSCKLSGTYLNQALASVDRKMEAGKFFYHYENNGWKIGGKVPMQNWKSACRSWVAKIPFFSKNERIKPNALHVYQDDHYDEPL